MKKKYRLSSLTLICETSGSYYEPGGRAPVQILARSFDPNDDLQKAFAKFRQGWEAEEVDAKAAVNSLESEFSVWIKTLDKKNYEILSAESAYYRPIYDMNGNVVGHMVIWWLYKDKSPLTIDPPVADKPYRMLATIYAEVSPV